MSASTTVPEPNYTQIPNVFFAAMPDMKEAELRILLAVARQTFGYHRNSDYLSITQLCKMTGLSRQGVVNGIAAAVERKWLSEIGKGKRGMRRWRLVLVNEVVQSDEATVQPSSIVPVNEVVQTPPSTIQPSRNTKERIPKETNQKKAAPLSDPFGNSMNVQYAAYLDAWRNAHEGVKPPALRGKERVDALEDVPDLIEMGCAIDDLTAFIQERQRNGKTTVWKFAIKEIHVFLNNKQKKADKPKVTPIEGQVIYVESTNQSMFWNAATQRYDIYDGKHESRPA